MKNLNDEKFEVVFNSILNSLKKDFNISVENSIKFSEILNFSDFIAESSNIRNLGENYNSLMSVFNILNENSDCGRYEAKYLSHADGINYPTREEIFKNLKYYELAENKIEEKLKDFELSKENIYSLYQMLERYLTYIPHKNFKNEVSDISLFDHIKMATAFSSCVYDYFKEKNISDYSVLSEDKKYLKEDMFYLYGFDFSGIQDFIYDIAYDGALKSLRTRSFYLEILLEDVIDNLFERLDLFRANLLYSGGGHCYLILPNTKFVKEEVEKLKGEVNSWLLDIYKDKLYLSGGGEICSAETFSGGNSKKYEELFRSISNKISENKLHRYSAEDLKKLNFEEIPAGERECRICKRVDNLIETKNGLVCETCTEIQTFSKEVLISRSFVVQKKLENPLFNSLPLPFGEELISARSEFDFARKAKSRNFVRGYSKNDAKIEEFVSTGLWIGDYSFDENLNSFSKDSKGINRLGVIRADVDNLGQAFVNGFSKEERTLTRSAVFSRNMSLFFKYHINYILGNGEFSLKDEKFPIKRKAMIVYSGGDDLFVVGAWDDIIGFSIDLVNSLKRFTVNSLTISAGIGLFSEKLPLKIIAERTGDLESFAKENKYTENDEEKSKNSVCLFDENNIYSWREFETQVLNEKFLLLKNYFTKFDERNKNFLYKILELLRTAEKDRLNIARLAYVFSRFKPGYDNKDFHEEFIKKIYRYSKNSKDRKEFITAIYIFIYLERK